jgi:hypothetical protein
VVYVYLFHFIVSKWSMRLGSQTLDPNIIEELYEKVIFQIQCDARRDVKLEIH